MASTLIHGLKLVCPSRIPRCAFASLCSLSPPPQPLSCVTTWRKHHHAVHTNLFSVLSTLFVIVLVIFLLISWERLLHLTMSGSPLQNSSEQSNPSEPTWAAFNTARTDLFPQSDRKRSPIPEELRNIDNAEHLPEKLRQILAWSLIPGPNPSSGKIVSNSIQQETEDTNLYPTHFEAGNSSISAVSESTSADETHPPAGSGTGTARDFSSAHGGQSSTVLRIKHRGASVSVFTSTLERLANLKSKTTKAPASQQHTSPPITISQPDVECTSCLDDIPESDTTKLPCNHSYCKSCLRTLITTALQHESSFPPKCCLTAVPLVMILAALDAEQRITYKEKAAEFSIPPQERWYCPNAACAQWIRPTKLFRIPAFNERCTSCSTRICTICRGVAHKNNTDCPQDFGLDA